MRILGRVGKEATSAEQTIHQRLYDEFESLAKQNTYDGDGASLDYHAITQSQFIQLMTNVLNLSQAELEDRREDFVLLFRAFDVNRGGSIDRSEFMCLAG